MRGVHPLSFVINSNMKKEETLKDVIENAYESFCSRMWLDHCDENKAPLCITYTKEEYIKRNWIWLLDKYSKEVEEENASE